jgi:hypothetical protein
LRLNYARTIEIITTKDLIKTIGCKTLRTWRSYYARNLKEHLTQDNKRTKHDTITFEDSMTHALLTITTTKVFLRNIAHNYS